MRDGMCSKLCDADRTARVTIDQGDINDKESLKKALNGAHSVYAMTNYWEKMDEKLEVQQGKNIADASKVRPIHIRRNYKLRRLRLDRQL